MEKTNSEKAIEKIEFLIDRLINYSESNKYDYALYKSFAKKSSKAFKRYFSEIDDQTIKDKIISDLKEDFQFKVNDVVVKMMAKPKGKIENFENGETYQITQPSQDNRIEGYESNYKELIELFITSVQLETKEPQQKETEENKHPKYNPKYMNKECFELFKYLYDEFCKGKIRQITNIWFYLNEFERNSISKKYILYCTKDQYKDFIKESYNIEIKNFDKLITNYEEKVRPNLNDHRQRFEDSLKQIAENVKNT